MGPASSGWRERLIHLPPDLLNPPLAELPPDEEDADDGQQQAHQLAEDPLGHLHLDADSQPGAGQRHGKEQRTGLEPCACDQTPDLVGRNPDESHGQEEGQSADGDEARSETEHHVDHLG
jgi:hypothetical protein